MVFSILFYFSFLQYSVFLFTFTFCGNHCFSILSAEQYTFTSFQQNSLFLFTLSRLFCIIFFFFSYFHFFSAEFTLTLYTFTSFLQNSLFFFTLPFCGFYCFAFPRICQTKMILQRMYCSQLAERFNYSNYCIFLTTLQILGPNLMILKCLPSTQIYRRSLNLLASVLGLLGLLIVQKILFTWNTRLPPKITLL